MWRNYNNSRENNASSEKAQLIMMKAKSADTVFAPEAFASSHNFKSSTTEKKSPIKNPAHSIVSFEKTHTFLPKKPPKDFLWRDW